MDYHKPPTPISGPVLYDVEVEGGLGVGRESSGALEALAQVAMAPSVADEAAAFLCQGGDAA